MEEIMFIAAKILTFEDILKEIDKAMAKIKSNGLTEDTKMLLAAHCAVFLSKIALGDRDVMDVLKKMSNNEQLTKAFNQKQ